MKANPRFQNLPLEFWANVKLINQKAGYTERGTSEIKIHTTQAIRKVYKSSELEISHILNADGSFTPMGQDIIDYITFRADVLNKQVQHNLLDRAEAKMLFTDLSSKLHPSCPQPMNKQKNEKKDFAYLTCIVNMLVEASLNGLPCNYDPKQLTSFTKNGFPIRTLSRRVDGAFPSIINPQAIWEIKEYYYTTTFGSRVADGVYETMLDGYELRELQNSYGIECGHYLIVDDKFTWWSMGRSYLCRIIDILHMGLLKEAIFGREVVTRIPEIVEDWKRDYLQTSPPSRTNRAGTLFG